MRKLKLLVFQHAPFEPLGTLDRQFKAAGLRVRYVNFSRLAAARPDVGRYQGLVVLGGPMGADQSDRYPHLEIEKDAIQEVISMLENLYEAWEVAVQETEGSMPGLAAPLPTLSVTG